MSTEDSVEKIVQASRAATALVSHIELVHGEAFTEADAQPISDLQHYLMDNMLTMKKDEAEAKITELFTLLDALEDKYGGEHEY